jgi:hypothetical protein
MTFRKSTTKCKWFWFGYMKALLRTNIKTKESPSYYQEEQWENRPIMP